MCVCVRVCVRACYLAFSASPSVPPFAFCACLPTYLSLCLLLCLRLHFLFMSTAVIVPPPTSVPAWPNSLSSLFSLPVLRASISALLSIYSPVSTQTLFLPAWVHACVCLTSCLPGWYPLCLLPSFHPMHQPVCLPACLLACAWWCAFGKHWLTPLSASFRLHGGRGEGGALMDNLEGKTTLSRNNNNNNNITPTSHFNTWRGSHWGTEGVQKTFVTTTLHVASPRWVCWRG